MKRDRFSCFSNKKRDGPYRALLLESNRDIVYNVNQFNLQIVGKNTVKNRFFRKKGKAEQDVKFSIRKKITLLSLAVAFPFLLLAVIILIYMTGYSRNYDQIVSNMTVANNYNLNFKEEMDESLYKLVVGYVSFENISDKDNLEDPYELIGELRDEFSNLLDITTDPESKVWLQSLLRNIDTLEKRVDDIIENVRIGGRYDENIEELDNNIYILTELIQDDIQYYIYYQTRSMEAVNNGLKLQITRFIIVCSILIAGLVLLAAFLIRLITSHILRPVRQLYSATQKIAEGDFDVQADVNSRDEIAVLARGFNDMAGNMQNLIEKIKEDEGKMRRADLRILQEQINPHFLYNTLDTIVWLIEGKKADQAVNMVVALSELFRMSLSKGKEFITLREEERHIRSYLEIQEVRYRDILEYDIQFDQVLYEYRILKLTLQPLVENALYHGIKYKRAKGYIHINGEKKGDVIYLTVRDNGVGMDPEELEGLREEISRPCQDTEKGFGLANVNERIRMYFGKEYGMQISSEKGKGTTVEIRIPAIRAEESAE